MNNIKKEFGKRLAEIRKSKKLRQEDLKELINAATIQMISNWENGHSFPSTSYLIILSKKLDVSLDYLLFGKENSPRNFEFRTYKDVCECITALIQDELFELGSYIDQNYMQAITLTTYDKTISNFRSEYDNLRVASKTLRPELYKQAIGDLLNKYDKPIEE